MSITAVSEPVMGAAPNQTAAELYVNPIFSEPKRESLLFDRLDPGLQAKIKALPDWRDYEDVDVWYNGCTDEMHLAIFWRAENHDGSFDKWLQSVGEKFDPDTVRIFDEIDLISAESDLGRIVLTRASDITMKPTKWLWRDHIPLGEITVLAGREDLGKSTIALTWGAQVTQGTLRGEYYGEPRDILICAVEDSWAETVVPRLTAAGADLKRAHQIEVLGGGGPDLVLSRVSHCDLRDS